MTNQPRTNAHGRLKAELRTSLRRGSVLVEFALVALVLYLLLAAIITFGFMLYAAQGVQQAVDLAAREISRTPLSPTITFEEALVDPSVKESVYSEDYLAIDVTPWKQNPGQDTLFNYLDGLNLPSVNKLLVPLMIMSDVNGTNLLRYPGALVTSETAPSGYTVKIPIVQSRDSSGIETIQWVDVLEEIKSASGDSPFLLSSDQRGIVALRMNYPYQSPVMSSFRPNPEGPFEPTISNPNVADDGAVSAINSIPGGGTLVAPDVPPSPTPVYSGTYGGQYGLGEQGALGSQQLTGGLPVRPYRRVISAQAIYRREVFGP
jgi:hypothetical protein